MKKIRFRKLRFILSKIFLPELIPAKLFRFALLFILFFINGILIAQTQLKYRVQFRRDERVYFAITDTSKKFTGPEMVQLRNQVFVDSIIREVTKTNDITTTKYHFVNSMFEDWNTQPAKSVIDKNKIALYGSDNSLLLSVPHSSKYLKTHKSLKTMLTSDGEDIIPTFPFVDESAIDSLVAIGYEYTNLGSDGARFIKDTIELNINNKKLTTFFRINSADGSEIASWLSGFIKNSDDQIVPSYRISKTWDDRFPDFCVQKTDIIDYENYKVTYFAKIREAGDDVLEVGNFELIIHPNPVDDVLNIFLTKDVFEFATLEIMDIRGKIYLSQNFSELEQDVIIPVKDLNAGIYFIRITGDNEEIYKPFYKN